MFFILSKILLFLIQPLNWIIGVLVSGWFMRKRKWGNRLTASGIVAAIFFTNPLAINLVTRAWELEPVAINTIEEPFDFGIVLGGFSRVIEEFPDRIHLNHHPNRLIHAMELYHAGKIRKILITGGNPSLVGEKPTDAASLRHFLTSSGIPDTDILVEDRSRNTHENAIFTAELLEAQQDASSHLLITSAFHMRRARACFQKAGLEVTPFVTDPMEDAIDAPTPDSLVLPKASALEQWNMLIKEWVGCLAYSVRGYL